MSETKTGQVAASAAEIYDEFFVPALFAEWAPRVCDAALVGEGHQVLDVACGTGAAAREAVRRVGSGGAVTGLDINEGMLEVARRHNSDIDWVEGPAEQLPFDDNSFDASISQFGLMFFVDPPKAVRELARVTRTGGRIAVAVWRSLEHTPGYSAMVKLLHRLFGDEAAEGLRAPYSMGDPNVAAELFRSAGLDPTVTTVAGTAQFPSIESWVHTDIRGWTLSEMIDDEQYQALLTAAQADMRRFVEPDGTVTFAHPALIITADCP